MRIVSGGLFGMARTTVVELAPIGVNGISPGLVALASAGAGQAVDAFKPRTPTRRPAKVDDALHGAFFLMGNRTANGIELELDGDIQLV